MNDNDQPNIEAQAGNPGPEAFADLPEEVTFAGDIGAAALSEAQRGREIPLGDEFDIDVVELPLGGPRLALLDGKLQIDSADLEAEKQSVNTWLQDGVSNGDESVMAVYLRNVVGDEEEVAELSASLKLAFEEQDIEPLKLDALKVDAITENISTRNLIRKGIREELLKQPCHFTDRKGEVLMGEDALDIVVVKAPKTRKKKDDGLKIIVGSKAGISSIVIPKDIEKSKFVPDLKKITKNKDNNSIIIPLLSDGEGNDPIAGILEVYLGAIDVVDILARQDEDEIEEPEYSDTGRSRSYSPPAPSPSPGRWTSYSG